MKQTITIPTSKIEDINKLAKKLGSRITINIEISKPYNKIYGHYRDDNYIDLMEHSMVDVTVETPDVNSWSIVAVYENGQLAGVSDMTKELILKNPNHGADYKICDACGHKTIAKSYVILNKETGEELQVGRECLKSFNAYNLYWVGNLIKELTSIFDYHKTGDLTDREFQLWPYSNENTGHHIYPVETVLSAAKYSYEKNNGVWISGFNDKDGYYRRSPSAIEIEEIITDKTNVPVLSNEYLDDLKRFISENIKPRDVYDEFGEMMFKFADHKYVPLTYTSAAFFVIKKYEESITPKKEQVVKVGDNVHVSGTVQTVDYCDGIFGCYATYTILSDTGYLFVRRGNVKYDSKTKRTEFYAPVEYISKDNTKYFIGRVTKNPKKNIEYINM